jgi:hypothetical protein
VAAGDVFEFDDLTPPFWWWQEDPTSETGFFLGSGQVLAAVDSKTGYILGWILIASDGYSARDIVQIVRDVHDAHGLPRHHFLFERGIWKRSKLITGHWSERPGDDICSGLSSVWRVQHTTSPKGKAIMERAFGLIQDRMHQKPGYTGRDMRKDCPEDTEANIREVKSGRCHPSKHFLHGTQVMEMMKEAVDSVNEEKLGIRTIRIPGQSPKDVFEARDRSTIHHFAENTWHVLATNELPIKVTDQGIKLPDSLVPKALRPAIYRGEATADLWGQEVICRVDPLDLRFIWITDRAGKNLRLVPAATRANPRFSDSATLSQAKRECAAHMSVVTVLRSISKPTLTPADFRPVPADGMTQRFGAQMLELKQAHLQERRETSSLSAEFNRLKARKGLSSLPKPPTPELLRSAVEDLRTMADIDNTRDHQS